jgi:hypothetical protein
MHSKLKATRHDFITAENILINWSYTTPRAVRQKNMDMSPAGPGTKNDSTGEDQ